MRLKAIVAVFAVKFVTTTTTTSAFTPNNNDATKTGRRSRHGSSVLYYQPNYKRTNIVMPILDVIGTDFQDKMVQPLPSSHLPAELSTLNVYSMPLTRPVHQQIMQNAIARGEQYSGGIRNQRLFGQIVVKDDKNDLVGAVGCAAEIIMQGEMRSVIDDQPIASVSDNPADTTPRTVVCRGAFRFIIKEVIQSVPFPVAVVDELLADDDNSSENFVTISKGDDKASIIDSDDDEDDVDDDDNDEDLYDSMDASALCRQTLQDMQIYVKQQLELAPSDMSPLEKAILQDSKLPETDINSQRQMAEEMVAVYDVFMQFIIDQCPKPADRYYAVAFMAAEMGNLNNRMRRMIIGTRNNIERLRLVAREFHEMVGMAKARQFANTITEDKDADEKDLKVGQPQMPPWIKQIKAGASIEYFWNEEYGWCKGKVVSDPVWIVDEYLIEVYFDDDGTTHKLPFRAEEKVRWRPA